MSPPLLAARQLVKKFGARTAVDGVSFTLERGGCTGLLGPNGAGKTTTLSMIAGLVQADSGEVLLDGKPLTGETDPRKKLLGLVPQELALYEELSAGENLSFFGGLYGWTGNRLAESAKSALAFVGLEDRAKDKVKTYSGGMKRRLNLAVALMHDPEILLLDEPTVGVDPQSRNAIFDNIEALRRQGKTILYTTHYMEEVERLCDRIIIIDHGHVIADDTRSGLKQRSTGAHPLKVELATEPDAATVSHLRGLPGVTGVEIVGVTLTLQLAELNHAGAILESLSIRRYAIMDVTAQRPSLEHIFLQLTGRSLRDG
ncbi:MAG TPA: ABC transporter ATP-binding protein [Candidatus Limnocylindria bacterium]|jgi:ABC-2 type transport system ATP-binding protein|nr:ABC transporter ATP-binding protein [Candidatus Limnocylindria bacterium]